ncbi:hypothetical protein ACL9RL_08560 [Plantibacter sp. Mn2098]|uniref:hypothetical protein n=1 Tax=Plantibacter sp. Mn2098 TaxID=3395266 RepID=UPI003BBE4F9F
MSEPIAGGSPRASAPEPSEWRRFTPDSIERRMLLAAGDTFGAPLRPQPLLLTRGSRVEVEGIDPDRRIIVQLVANQGAYKPTYRNKVMADMFKLLWLRSSVDTVDRAVLIVTDVASQALGGWVAQAAEDLGIEVHLFADGRIEPLRSQR